MYDNTRFSFLGYDRFIQNELMRTKRKHTSYVNRYKIWLANNNILIYNPSFKCDIFLYQIDVTSFNSLVVIWTTHSNLSYTKLMHKTVFVQPSNNTPPIPQHLQRSLFDHLQVLMLKIHIWTFNIFISNIKKGHWMKTITSNEINYYFRLSSTNSHNQTYIFVDREKQT